MFSNFLTMGFYALFRWIYIYGLCYVFGFSSY